MNQNNIERINELARKSRTPQGLTDDEKIEQQALRLAYVNAIKASLRSQLDQTVIVEPNGDRRVLKPKKPRSRF